MKCRTKIPIYSHTRSDFCSFFCSNYAFLTFLFAFFWILNPQKILHNAIEWPFVVRFRAIDGTFAVCA